MLRLIYSKQNIERTWSICAFQLFYLMYMSYSNCDIVNYEFLTYTWSIQSSLTLVFRSYPSLQCLYTKNHGNEFYKDFDLSLDVYNDMYNIKSSVL